MEPGCKLLTFAGVTDKKISVIPAKAGIHPKS
jgi:hypothetical protein